MCKINLFKTLSILFGIFLFLNMPAQKLNTKDSLFVDFLPKAGMSFVHKVEPGSTLYSISKKYRVELDDIFRINKSLKNKPLEYGLTIYVPVSEGILVNKKAPANKNYEKVYYKVKEKETIFRVAKIKLDISIEELKRINFLKSNEIQAGQILYVGYFNEKSNAVEILPEKITGSKGKVILKDDRNIISKPILVSDNRKNSEIEDSKLQKDAKKIVKANKSNTKNAEIKIAKTDNDYNDINQKIKEKKRIINPEVKEKMEFVSVISRPVSIDENQDTEVKPQILKSHYDSGIALWNKESRVRGTYVLCNEAALNTMIEISNPMVQRKIFARVIGNIPLNTYPDNVKVVLSPDAALDLGAVDSRFFVKLNYLK
jgi:LysM repeat protein